MKQARGSREGGIACHFLLKKKLTPTKWDWKMKKQTNNHSPNDKNNRRTSCEVEMLSANKTITTFDSNEFINVCKKMCYFLWGRCLNSQPLQLKKLFNEWMAQAKTQLIPFFVFFLLFVDFFSCAFRRTVAICETTKTLLTTLIFGDCVCMRRIAIF